MGLRWCGPVVACVLTSSIAHAAPSDLEPIRVDYIAPAECPTEEAFVERILTRTAKARREPDAARTFIVRLSPGAEESAGHLVMHTADGTDTERDVVGDTCEEVADALALMAALAIDPHASTSPAPPPLPPPALLAAAPIARDAPLAPSRPRPRWSFGASAGASFAGGIAPSALFGVPIAIHAVAPAHASFHLAFEHTSSGSVDVPRGAASFMWTTGILEGCYRWTRGAVGIEPCLRAEGGRVRARGAQIVPAREDTRGWLALGAVGRADWKFAGPMFLEIEGGLRAPLARTTYYFQADTTIYRTPAVAGIFGLGVGALFL